MHTPKYTYPRVELTVRMSIDAWDLLNELCSELRVSKNDAILYAILSRIDPSKIAMEDWNNLSPALF